jgi:hypothetical protein
LNDLKTATTALISLLASERAFAEVFAVAEAIMIICAISGAI